MRTLFTLGFFGLVAVAFALYVLALISAFVFVSLGQFVVWLTTDGLPVTIGAAVVVIVALAFGRCGRRAN
ncbi:MULTISPECIES: hypothetical protein [Microbacterium]|uniref:Uncharacterized protein n=1 Tax=Microbacterium dextranolyticum TaxID=36806 RepID=A0A9W6HLY4_9MICO|nr:MULTISPECIES: hypothetical protein [Microbacterium]MBF9335399.1 hypothetical protein [Microbacterium lacticum]MBM7463174.1 hypothetical protein [Microbacterium dextranolyticum]GLJ95720.1 hypothetical protein GCM10017591_17830 [Microbacterium dextranolyticum]